MVQDLQCKNARPLFRAFEKLCTDGSLGTNSGTTQSLYLALSPLLLPFSSSYLPPPIPSSLQFPSIGGSDSAKKEIFIVPKRFFFSKKKDAFLHIGNVVTLEGRLDEAEIAANFGLQKRCQG